MLLLISYLSFCLACLIQGELSFNQPSFCSNASWNSTGIIFADNQTLQSNIWDIFITKNNTIYVPDLYAQRILVWFDGNQTATMNISINSSLTISVFVTEDNSIYFDYQQNSIIGINQLTSNKIESIMASCDRCYDIFVDINNNIYCSMVYVHKVIRKSLNLIQTIAGTGVNESTANTLYCPAGIFVDTNFDLYVADHYNHRIQLFPLDQTDGITVAGNLTTITLKNPVAVTLDANRYLFIADQNNHRIVGSGPDGFRCIIGCNGSSYAALWRSLSFDTFGNLFAVDLSNNRIVKFPLSTNSCSKFFVRNQKVNNQKNFV